MPHWPLGFGPTRPVSLARSAAPAVTRVTVTAHATPHTKGSWVELVASLARSVWLVDVDASGVAVSATNTGLLFDIGVGSAGNEKVLIPDLNAGFAITAPQGMGWRFPLYIPAGTRVAARCQAVITLDTVDLACDFWGGVTLEGPGRSFAAVDALGVVSASSRGTNIVAGLSGAEGSWTELVASTPQAYGGLALGAGGAGDTTSSAADLAVDIGIGGAGSEKAIWSDVMFRLSAAEALSSINPIRDLVCPMALSIPKGSRISARVSMDAGSAQSLDVIAYGLRR